MNENFRLGFEKRAYTLNTNIGSHNAEMLVQHALKRGDDSLAMIPLKWLGKKTIGLHNTHRMVRKFNRGSLEADSVLGTAAHKVFKHIPGLRSIFLRKEKIPVGLGSLKGDGKLYKEIQRPSFTEPLSKARNIAAPAILMVASDGYLRKMRDAKKRVTQDSSGENASALGA